MPLICRILSVHKLTGKALALSMLNSFGRLAMADRKVEADASRIITFN